LATLAIPFLVKDRRAWLGVAGFWVLLTPMLFLPSRLFPAYLYVPLALLSIAAAAIASGRKLALIALFFAIWLPVNHFELRKQRKSMLAYSDENRRYVESTAEYFRAHPEIDAAVIDGDPEMLNRWGTESAIRLVSGKPGILIRHFGDSSANTALDSPGVLLLSWDRHIRRVGLRVKQPGEGAATWVEAGANAPLWLLRDGWHQRDGSFRWVDSISAARAFRPPNSRAFRLKVNTPEGSSDAPSVELFLDGKSMGSRQFPRTGVQQADWSLPAAPAGDVQVGFKATSSYRDSVGGSMGIPVMAFGFIVE
jgi:hypothetical protein